MDNTIQKILISLGLDSKEIRFYETSFKMGPSTINEVAKNSRLQRSTAYLIAQELIKKGFLQEDLKQYKKKITALNPSQLLRLLSSKQRLLRRQEIELEEALPTLQALYQDSEIKPKVRLYEGKEGLVQIWNDVLSTKGEVLCWTNQEAENIGLGLLNEKFIKERIKRKIKIRVFAVSNLGAETLQEKDSQSIRMTKILPEETYFATETYIYDNKVAILDYQKDIIGVITESLPMTIAQRSIFELLWSKI